jgi:hypothetical protein
MMNKAFDEMIAPMRAPMFEAGKKYRTRDGSLDLPVVFVTGNGSLVVEMPDGFAQIYHADGWNTAGLGALDLMPPAPPVVVSDAVLTTHIKARGFRADDLSRFDDARAHLAVVIAAYLAEQGR